MERDRPDRPDDGEKAALMGAVATEADEGPAAARSDESAPSVASGNAFARCVFHSSAGDPESGLRHSLALSPTLSSLDPPLFAPLQVCLCDAVQDELHNVFCRQLERGVSGEGGKGHKTRDHRGGGGEQRDRF